MEMAWNRGSKELMEDKQLNFDQPLLSVRKKFSPPVTSEKKNKYKTANSVRTIPRLPHYKSELKSGPVSNPGTVPFVWEQKPGRPKEDIKIQTQNSDKPPIAPKLPPGRSTKANQQASNKVSAISSVSKIQLQNVPREVQRVPSVLDKRKNINNFKETKEDDVSSHSGDSEEAYVDALDTISRTESFFVNCSVSGVSGFDELDMKPSGRVSTDPQLQEFMMGRFLPAAKALASETPEYVPKRQPAVQEQQPRQIKKKVMGDKPQLRYGPSFANRYSHRYQDSDGDDEDEESDDGSRHGDLPGVCGLLPRFCYKSSLCLLNPVPAMSARTRVPRSPANRIQARTSSAGSFSGTENEPNSDTSQQKSAGEVQIDEAMVDKTGSRNRLDSNHQQRQNLRGSSLRLPPDEHNTYNHRDESPGSIHEEIRVLAIPEETKDCKTFQEILSDQSSSKELDSTIPVEKTLYVDAIQKVECPRTRSFSPPKQLEQSPGSRDKDYIVITKSIDQHKLLTADKGAKLLPHTPKSSESIVVSSINKSGQKEEMEMIKAVRRNQDVYQNSKTAKSIEVENAAKESSQKQPVQAENLENSHQSNFQLPAPPPLPKSPSDSWLFRTLPSISVKNSSLRSYLGTTINSQNQAVKAQTTDPKWETMVKTTKLTS